MQRTVAAMGGHLTMIATFPDQEISSSPVLVQPNKAVRATRQAIPQPWPAFGYLSDLGECIGDFSLVE
jgi:hypothetical protein